MKDDYLRTIAFLFSQLPQYQNSGVSAYKEDLSNIIAICKLLDNPQEQIKTIHVAGSNGKGSTSHMIASVLQEAGYKVGLYTSPHLKDFRERIRINGKKIPKKKVVQFVEDNSKILKTLSPSFFEWTVGLAFDFFAKNKTDINVIETGLGGRLDSTNIITPEVSVITNISLEHTSILGSSIEQITKEKGGIIKNRIPVVIGESQKETKSIFIDLANKHNSPFYFADDLISKEFRLDLVGEYQQKNAKTCAQTIEILTENDWKINDKHISKGLKNVKKNTKLLGRFQHIDKKPQIIADTAHNPDGISVLLKEINKLNFNRLHIVCGFAKDKDLSQILTVLDKKATYYFCSSSNERILDGNELKLKAIEAGLTGNSFTSVKQGLDMAKESSDKNDLILITGSNFIVADIL